MQSVLASRLSSCMRKSRRRPAASPPPMTRRVSSMCPVSRSSSSATSRRCSCIAISCSMRRDPRRRAVRRRVRCSRVADAYLDLRQPCAHLDDQRRQAGAALLDELTQALALAQRASRPGRRASAGTACGQSPNKASESGSPSRSRPASAAHRRHRRSLWAMPPALFRTAPPRAPAPPHRSAARARRPEPPRRCMVQSTLPRLRFFVSSCLKSDSSGRSSSGRRNPGSR